MKFLMKKIIILVLMGFMTSGCAPLRPAECQKKSALEDCQYNRSGKVSDRDAYGEQASGIKMALDAALADKHAWKGKRCTMHLDFNIDGSLRHLIVKDGDKDYCQALEEAAKNAKFPPFTDQHIFDVMGSARWDMHGLP